MIGGDKEITRYIDAIVLDIKEKLDVGFECSVFGGSNYDDFFSAVEEETIKYPVIRLDTVVNFTDECTEYLIKKPDGSVFRVDCDYILALPCAYDINLKIIYDKETEAKV